MANFSTRTNSRLKAICKLCQFECSGDDSGYSFDGIYDELLEELGVSGTNIDKEFLDKLYNGVIDNLKAIDRIISINLSGYTLDRLNIVDRNIIRVATLEMKFLNTSPQIVINEALNITKALTESNDVNFSSRKFNNKLLDDIAKS